MSRDYNYQKSPSSKKNYRPLIFGLFIGYTLGLLSAIGVWMYISQAPSPFLSDNKPVTAPKVVQTKPSKKETTAAVEKQLKFDFYKILPGIEEPATDQEFNQELHQQQKAQPVEGLARDKPTVHYFLQVGAFRSTDEAENLKARLALLGLVATVQSADLPEKGIWHRVRIGPFTRMADVNQVRTSLLQYDIEASFIKVRGNQN